MRIIDLSQPLDANGWEPDEIEHRIVSHREGAVHMADELKRGLDIDFEPDVFPNGEFLNLDFITASVHAGTHVDASLHYGTNGTYGPTRSIDQMPLEWFIGNGVLLTFKDHKVGTISAADLQRELDRIGYQLQPLDIVLINTGSCEWTGSIEYFTTFQGLDKSAIHFLLDAGIKVIGTDAFSLDAPFGYMINLWKETQNFDDLWPAHFAGLEKEYCQIERMSNLDTLPKPYGFQISCLPVKIAGAGAGWSRVVAILDEE